MVFQYFYNYYLYIFYEKIFIYKFKQKNEK